jgi:hypothetical protein
MSSVIDKLIQDRDSKIKSEAEARARAIDEQAEKHIEAMRAAFGDFWSIVEELGAGPIAVTSNGAFSFIRLDIPASDKYRIAPIRVEWNQHSERSGYSHYTFGVFGRSYKLLPEALAAARESFEEYKESLKKKHIEALEKEVSWAKRDQEEAVRSAIEKLIEIAPEREEEWKADLEKWISQRDEKIRYQEERKREQKEVEELRRKIGLIKQDYTAALVEWIRARNAIEASNEIEGERIQNSADLEQYRVYKLTYALIATDEDEGSNYIETRHVWTRDSDPDEWGAYTVDGRRFKVFNPVSLEAFDVSPSRGACSKDIQKGGREFYFAPYVSDIQIRERLSKIQELPDQPAPPAELDYYERDGCLSDARSKIGHETHGV